MKTVPKISCEVENITPAKAAEYLKHNTDNYRKIKRHIVREYLDDILNGRWELNGESIVFDANGVLKDGQHRLAAIYKSGKTIPTVVVRGVSPDVKIYDMGGRRTNSDIANAMGAELDSTAIAAANIIVNRFSGIRGGTKVIDYATQHAAELNRALRVTCYGTGSKSKNAPSVAATYLLLRTNAMPCYEIELFFRLMNDFGFTSADGYEVSSALVAQRMFDERGTKHSGHQIQKERLEILIMALKDFHDGKKRENNYKIKEPFRFMELLTKIRKEDGLED